MFSVSNSTIIPLSYPQNTPIAIAVSGGVDSMYLALYLHQQHSHDYPMVALIIDHKLRAESTDEAIWVASYLKHKGITAHILDAQFPPDFHTLRSPDKSTQEAAREARYKALLDYCVKNNIKYLCFGHNLDDLLETLIMNIERGSGLDGAASIPATLVRQGVTILRPFLHTPRALIIEQMETMKACWIEDPSNSNEQFKRVRVRKWLKTYPDYSILLERAALFSENIRRTQSFIEEELIRAEQQLVIYDHRRFAQLVLAQFRILHEEMRLRLLIKILERIGGKNIKPRLENLLRLVNEMEGGAIGQTFHNCELMSKDNILFIMPEYKAMLRAFQKDKDEMLHHFFNVHIATKYRAEGNYTIALLGRAGYMTIKKLIDLPKLPSHRIYYSYPGVFDREGNLIAVYELYGPWDKFFEAL